MYWVQDQFRCDEEPDHTKFTLEGAHNAIERAAARKLLTEQSDTVAKPGQLKGERDFPKFVMKLALTVKT